MCRFQRLGKLKQNKKDFFSIRCKKCLMPNHAWTWNDAEGNTCRYCTPPNAAPVSFPADMRNENGDMAIEDIQKLIEARRKAPYDCMVSFTGGRDSVYTLYYAKKVLGLNPIAFNFHTGFVTDIAQRNMVHITNELGVDFLQFKLDWQFQKKLARGFFITNGEVCSVCHQGYFYTVQKMAQWTGQTVILRGLCKKTEGHRILPDYVNWYCLSDEEFNQRVNAFSGEMGISTEELERHSDFMELRKWFDREIRRIDIPDLIEYDNNDIMKILNKLGWKHENEIMHSDCLFAPILVCCQRYAEGYSKKHVNVSNLVLSDIDNKEGKKLLWAEENIGFEDVEHLDYFMNRIEVDEQTFESSVVNNWKARGLTALNTKNKLNR